MKKIGLFLFCLIPCLSYAGEPLMLVKASREIFVNFPSATLPDKAVSVFLPEQAIPLKGKYPVVYVLGAVPTDAAAAQEIIAKAQHKAILVGLNVTEKEMENVDKLVTFVSRELVPYIDTNYATYDQPAFRAIAVSGKHAAKVLGALLGRKNLFTKGIVWHGGANPLPLVLADKPLRLLVVGEQAELAAWTRVIQSAGLRFGPGFITRLTAEKSAVAAVDLDYLFAPDAEVVVEKLTGTITPNHLYAAQQQHATVSLLAELANGMRVDPIVLNWRISPPYLDWDAASATLTPLPGAAAGKVKMSATVDKKIFTGKIKLKK